jgi:C1A family cysteine protease
MKLNERRIRSDSLRHSAKQGAAANEPALAVFCFVSSITDPLQIKVHYSFQTPSFGAERKSNMTIEAKAIAEAIQSAGAAWQSGESFLTLATPEERRSRLGYSPGPGEPTLNEAEQMAMQAAATSGMRAQGAPAAFDLRNANGKNYISPVKDQGSCGSCVSFGSVATVEGTTRYRNGKPDLAIDLSEAHLFYCHARQQGRNCGNGWWVPPALDAFKTIGVSDEACYPYVAGDQNCSNLCNDWQTRAVKITSWTEVGTAAKMKEWLSTKGPLVACFSVYEDFFAYKSGVYRHVTGNLAGGHCISCVGYDDVAGCWICKNSWSTAWGESGYFRIAYGDSGIDARMWGVEVPKTETKPDWIEKKTVTGLWVVNEPRNASAYVEGTGWCKVADTTDSAFAALVTALATAKSCKSPVNIRMADGVIAELYVF